jgi:hypothetical protein
MPEVNCTCDAADWVPPALHSEFCAMRVPPVPVSRVQVLSLTAEVQDAISHLLAVHDASNTCEGCPKAALLAGAVNA